MPPKKPGRPGTQPPAEPPPPEPEVPPPEFYFQGKSGDRARELFSETAQRLRDADQFRFDHFLCILRVRQHDFVWNDMYLAMEKNAPLYRLQTEIANRLHGGSVFPNDVLIFKKPPGSGSENVSAAKDGKDGGDSGGNVKSTGGKSGMKFDDGVGVTMGMGMGGDAGGNSNTGAGAPITNNQQDPASSGQETGLEADAMLADDIDPEDDTWTGIPYPLSIVFTNPLATLQDCFPEILQFRQVLHDFNYVSNVTTKFLTEWIAARQLPVLTPRGSMVELNSDDAKNTVKSPVLNPQPGATTNTPFSGAPMGTRTSTATTNNNNSKHFGAFDYMKLTSGSPTSSLPVLNAAGARQKSATKPLIPTTPSQYLTIYYDVISHVKIKRPLTAPPAVTEIPMSASRPLSGSDRSLSPSIPTTAAERRRMSMMPPLSTSTVTTTAMASSLATRRNTKTFVVQASYRASLASASSVRTQPSIARTAPSRKTSIAPISTYDPTQLLPSTISTLLSISSRLVESPDSQFPPDMNPLLPYTCIPPSPPQIQIPKVITGLDRDSSLLMIESIWPYVNRPLRARPATAATTTTTSSSSNPNSARMRQFQGQRGGRYGRGGQVGGGGGRRGKSGTQHRPESSNNPNADSETRPGSPSRKAVGGVVGVGIGIGAGAATNSGSLEALQAAAGGGGSRQGRAGSVLKGDPNAVASSMEALQAAAGRRKGSIIQNGGRSGSVMRGDPSMGSMDVLQAVVGRGTQGGRSGSVLGGGPREEGSMEALQSRGGRKMSIMAGGEMGGVNE
ncbi:hypothetical protein HDU76_004657 [Blyttiomyces sp. JEL0837]|nr:hypothetical protein HDU76_004657 [Blyttiomyces sp. JEL0837]